MLSEPIFGLEKISTDSTEIFYFSAQSNYLKKIDVIFPYLDLFDDDVNIVGNIICANKNISYLKIFSHVTQAYIILRKKNSKSYH